jgi:predicted trehalose synthase
MDQAVARLEAAVEQLGLRIARLRAAAPAVDDDGAMVPRAEVAALAARLDAALSALRGALAQEAGDGPEEE